ncbi:MAG: hypothetical protein K6T88_14605 [Bacillus sp. (in: Bacteria)]|nr:hypothetical protein [Bacillus sp. (in: firmicutes)]
MTDIYIPKLNKEKVTAVLTKRILQGRDQFYLPYTLNEVNFDGYYKLGQFIMNQENQSIFNWIKEQKISYQLIPVECRYEFENLRSLYFFPDIHKWLHKKEPLTYPLEFPKIDNNRKITGSYWKAHVWMELTDETILDESTIDNYFRI